MLTQVHAAGRVQYLPRVEAVPDGAVQVRQGVHRQPAAYDRVFSADSDIFSVDCKMWNTTSPKEMHNIHRYRHILVTNIDPGKQIKFNVDGLKMLADIDGHTVDIQCMWGFSLS